MHSRIRALLTDIMSASDENATCAEMRRILAGDVVLDMIASESLAIGHVLGFTQIRLGALGGRVVRLHFWTSRTDPVRDVHSHAWPIRSHVLAGTMENRLFDVGPDADAGAALYEVTYHPGGTRRVFTGTRVRAELACAERVGRDQSYEVGSAAFHDSDVTSGDAITLVVSGEPAGGPPLVVGPRADPVWPEYPLTPLDPARLRSSIALLRKELIT